MRHGVLAGFGRDSRVLASRLFRCLYTRAMREYVNMLFSKLRSDDAPANGADKNQKTFKFLDVGDCMAAPDRRYHMANRRAP